MLNDINSKPMTAARILVLLLAQEMDLDSASQIWLANQNKKLPNDDGLYVTCGMVDSQVISNFRTTESTDTGMSETQILVMRENIQIDIYSRSNDAEFRRWEIVSALQSVYAQQLQEKYQFKIFRIPSSFINTSGAEGGSNINRFSVIVPCHVWYKKTKAIDTPEGDFFDKFPARVDDESTIAEENGLIKLNLSDWVETESWIDLDDWIE